MSEDEAIKVLKTALEQGKEMFETYGVFSHMGKDEQQAIETILDLYKNTKYELKGQEALVDTMSHNEEVLTSAYEILENKLRQEREKNKELEEKLKMSIAMLTKGTYPETKKGANDFDNYFISKDKIRAKIKELEEEQKEYKGSQEWEIQDDIDAQINILKELLEEG